MNLQDLVEKLKINNIPESLYSIEQGLKPNSYILSKNYSTWEYFYLDEKGDRIDKRTFNDEGKACDYFWNKIKVEMSHPPSIPPKSVYGDE